MTAITELIKNKGQFSYSLEVTPDVSADEIDKLKIDPVFFSITWHAKLHKCRDMNIQPLKIARMLTSKQKQILFHISCDMMRRGYLKELLVTLQGMNICNLFLILGENYDRVTSDFENTSELIKFIRNQTGNYFCIGIPGFPDCSQTTLEHLKEKIYFGADFIITQAFFDVSFFKSFRERCKINNINVPIIPGIFPFDTPKQLISFINYCKILITPEFMESIKTLEELKKSCLEITKLLMRDLSHDCNVNHFHLFTLNKLQRINSFLQDYLSIDNDL